MADGPVLVGAGGRAFIAPVGTTQPTSPDYLDLAPAWIPLGILTDDGVNFNDETSMINIPGWRERRPVRRIPGDRNTVATFTLRQWNPENLKFALGGGTFDVNGTYTPRTDDELPADWELFITWIDEGDHYAIWFPRGEAGASVQFNLKRDENAALPVEYTVVSDPDDTDPPYKILTENAVFIAS